MIQRPNPSRVLALCHKFNAILEETLYKTPGMYILGVDEDLNASHFDQSNYLLEHGKTTYWHSIDKALKQFDNHEGPKLKPEPVISAAPAEKKQPRYALPRPPPRR